MTKRHTQSFKSQALLEQMKSGQTIKNFCESKGIHFTTFYKWKAESANQAPVSIPTLKSQSMFLPVKLETRKVVHARSKQNVVARIKFDKFSLNISSEADPRWVVSVLKGIMWKISIHFPKYCSIWVKLTFESGERVWVHLWKQNFTKILFQKRFSSLWIQEEIVYVVFIGTKLVLRCEKKSLKKKSFSFQSHAHKKRLCWTQKNWIGF